MKKVKEIFLEWESEKIFSMPLRYAQNEDSQFQSLSRDGRYYVKSGYKIAMKSKPDVVASSSRILGDWWKKLWKIRTQPRCSQFVCKVCPDIIPIRQNLMRRGMMLDPNCPRCGEKVESATHALLTCGKVRIWWFTSPLAIRVDENKEGFVMEWLEQFMRMGNKEVMAKIFEFLYIVWRCKNLLVFEQKFVPLPQIFACAEALHVKEWKKSQKEDKVDLRWCPHKGVVLK